MSRRSVLEVVVDDTAPIPVEFEGKDLSTFSTIEADVRRVDGTTHTITATIVDASGGLFEIPRSSNDFQKGDNDMEIKFTETGGDVFTIPVSDPIIVRARANIP